ncbi:PstS family phosphate ABC transporter substrate-binding protein [Acerihabitans arboris]|uniref:Solute-binding protein n=1 Tax=Acerihabitans arboris TaxID=2691583 RepID=A0A845SLU8_9GAMM|nr:substrate-binding domain-containing protein [Acerihabitans arboris]NDL64969.1 solute-binding protein [Acerihabitans arboris]
MINAVKTLGWLLCLLLALPAAARPLSVLSGNLTSSGSDTLANMMTLWAADFSRDHPDVSVQIQAGGSATAATALAAGTAQIGPMSRVMTAAETAAFQRRYGYPPLAVPVALDALVILVNQDNPLPTLRLSQLDAIFSITRSCGDARAITRWDELGLTGAWNGLALLRYGRNSASGTYGFFRQRALCGGDLLPSVNELPGSASVAQAVAASRNAIGYAGMGFHATGVRILPLTDQAGRQVMPDESTLRNGDYPLVRYLYIYINKAPDKPPAPAIAAFMDRILSPRGQGRARQGGYQPLPEPVRLRARRDIGLE